MKNSVAPGYEVACQFQLQVTPMHCHFEGRTTAILSCCLAGLAIAAFALWWSRDRHVVSSKQPRHESSGPVALKSLLREAAQHKAPIPTEQLLTLDSVLRSLEPGVSAKAVREFLSTGADAPTGLEFRLAADGSLESAPTLRTFLLDQLSKIDLKATVEIEETILAQKTSADEWAIALRNYARLRSDEAGKVFLKNKVRELLEYEPWRRAPTVGFLEAFDILVHLRATEFTPDLIGMVQNRNAPALAHAAFLTLDRLSQLDPNTVLPQLLLKDEAWSGREETRAGLLARARLTEPAGRTLVESYLLDPRIKPAEHAAFAAVFPNANHFVSHNLLTPPPQIDAATLAREDRDAFAAVEAWLTDPRFSSARPFLETMRQRLREFTRVDARF